MLRRQVLTGPRYQRTADEMWDVAAVRGTKAKNRSKCHKCRKLGKICKPTIEQRNIPSFKWHTPSLMLRVYIPGVRRKLWLFSEGALGVPSMLISGLQNYNDPMLRDHTRRYPLRHQGVPLFLVQAHCPLRQTLPLRLSIPLQPAGIPSMPPILLH